MSTLKFKTNINCGGCIEKVTPFLNGNTDIASWQVDTTDREKILTVETADMQPMDVIALLTKAGFKAEIKA